MHASSIPISRCLLLLALSAGASDAFAIERYEGLAYAKKGGKLLYLETHWIQDKGRRLVLYRCPDGSVFARKQVMGGGPAPDFELVDGRDGYREGVRTRNGVREVFTRPSATAAERAKPLPAPAGLVIDAGFDAFVRQHWGALAQVDSRRVRFLVPSRLESIDFQLTSLAGDENTRRYRLALDAWYGGVVPNVTVTYAADDQRLMRFEGIGNLRDHQGRYPAVRIEFPSHKRGTATLADLAGAARMPLVKGCAA